MKLPILLLASLLSLIPLSAQESSIAVYSYNNLRLVFGNSLAVAYRDGDKTGSVLYRDSDTYLPYERKCDQPPTFVSTRYKALSVVGPIVSFGAHGEQDGGAHPTRRTWFNAVDIQTMQPATLLTYFSETEILNAFLHDSILKPRIKPNTTIRSLGEFFRNVDGGCELAINESMLGAFAFHHLQGDQVAIRIGISHGCEVNRGNFAQIGFYLPIPPKLARDLRTADAEKRLMKALAPNAFMQ